MTVYWREIITPAKPRHCRDTSEVKARHFSPAMSPLSPAHTNDWCISVCRCLTCSYKMLDYRALLRTFQQRRRFYAQKIIHVCLRKDVKIVNFMFRFFVLASKDRISISFDLVFSPSRFLEWEFLSECAIS